MNSIKTRCSWVITDDPLSVAYHDTEWGVPVWDDRLLFEFLCLEGMQAGLSWHTILKKRQNYQKNFSHFDPKKIIRFNEEKIEKLLQDPGIIRNRLKVNSIVTNARLFFEVEKEYGSFANYIWHFVDNKPIKNQWKKQNQVPATSEISDKMSRDLKKRGFKFVGSTICYAYMQAVGMVNDHVETCFRHSQIKAG